MRIKIASLAFAFAVAIGATGAYAENPRAVPAFQVDPFWPKPLPNNWILGQVARPRHRPLRSHLGGA